MEKVVGGRAASAWAVPEQLRSWRDRMATVSLADLDDDQHCDCSGDIHCDGDFDAGVRGCLDVSNPREP